MYVICKVARDSSPGHFSPLLLLATSYFYADNVLSKATTINTRKPGLYYADNVLSKNCNYNASPSMQHTDNVLLTVSPAKELIHFSPNGKNKL